MKRWLCLISFGLCLVALTGNVPALEAGQGIVQGKVTGKAGESLSGGTVRFFDMAIGPSPFTHEYWRHPDYFFPIADDGSFSAEIPEGTYSFSAVKMVPGKRAGCPPEEGDFIYPPWDGTQKSFSVRAGETTDLGVIAGAVAFRKEWAAAGKSGIAGILLDADGRPVDGKIVIASATASMERPYFVSDRRTGSNGAYTLRVPEGGMYHVRVMGYRQPIVPAAVQTGKITRGIDIMIQLIAGADSP